MEWKEMKRNEQQQQRRSQCELNSMDGENPKRTNIF